ncbi:uncharacterized protein N7469_006150 [Penicillium citrinum]|uniref:Uncharacterized protein n=1 Tax=Penicillium citrinum TaxID=5077 RepID=A0A9W9TMB0_PENCI|nr:uncharacterized protein N7469_006150 [Penicillium citrinum]KAJ5231562.1 hypothetical protein N7469_006150 [Penicillium citrinum]
MPAKNTPDPKTLGRSSGSLNAPIAAFTMALILGSYCISSIRTARRDAQGQSISAPDSAPRRPSKGKDSWIQQALEESRSGKGGKT